MTMWRLLMWVLWIIVVVASIVAVANFVVDLSGPPFVEEAPLWTVTVGLWIVAIDLTSRYKTRRIVMKEVSIVRTEVMDRMDRYERHAVVHVLGGERPEDCPNLRAVDG